MKFFAKMNSFLRRLHVLQVYDEDKMPYRWFGANSFEVNTSNKRFA